MRCRPGKLAIRTVRRPWLERWGHRRFPCPSAQSLQSDTPSRLHHRVRCCRPSALPSGCRSRPWASPDNRIGRTHARRHVGHPSGRHATDQYRWTARWKDRPAHVGLRPRIDHGANVIVANTCCGRHGKLILGGTVRKRSNRDSLRFLGSFRGLVGRDIQVGIVRSFRRVDRLDYFQPIAAT